MAKKNVVGLFDTQSDAQAALRELQSSGFSGDNISFVANNARGEYSDNDSYGTARSGTATEAEEGAGFGATGGAVLGGLGGLLVGLGALAIPGIGPAVAAGTLATTLGSTALGAGLGAAAGGLTGALVGAGIPEHDADVYAEGVRRGGAMVMVQADSDDDANRAADIMDRHNVVDIDERGSNYRSGGWNRFDSNAGPYDLSTTSDYDTSNTRTMGSSNASYASSTSGGDYSMSGTGDADTNIDRDDYDRSSKVGTAGGGLAGAATGAAIGSAGGPIGTVIGGIAGAVTGGGVGAAGDAAGAEATDDHSDHSHAGMTSTSGTAGGTAYGSATDYSTTSTTGTTGYTSGTTGMTGSTGYTTSNIDQGGEIKVPIVEEELAVGKREVETGGVRVNTNVQEIPVSEQVTVRDEHIDIHRKPVNRPVSDADINAFQEGTFEVRETDEEVIVDKQARVVEEVVINKDVRQRTETIQDTVRRTDVDVEQIPGQTRSVGTSNYDTTGTMNTTDSTLGTSSNEGMIEGGTSRLGNAIEGGTGLDIDRDGDVGQRDPRNNF